MRKPLPPPWDRFLPLAQKIFVWAMVFGVLWLLRHFFILVFLTFVFGYVLQHVVIRTERLVRSRRLRVVMGFLLLLSVLMGVGWTIGPALVQQAKDFPGQLNVHLDKLDEVVQQTRERSPTVARMIPAELRVRDVLSEILPVTPRPRPVGLGPHDAPPDAWGDQRWRDILPLMISLAQQSVAIGSAFLLSLLFSFLIVLDLPRLARGARHLHDTRLQFVYDEISDSVVYFGRVLGRALEAQLMIAVVNTIMTAIGLYFMKLPNLAFLSMVVFVCSFIPVAGVFISSVPICLAALTAGGLSLLLVSIAFITLIHIIEAYIMNPRLYGAHLHMNPVLVLAILVVSHHLFGIWGLILGVPVVSFAVRYVIDIKSGRVAGAST